MVELERPAQFSLVQSDSWRTVVLLHTCRVLQSTPLYPNASLGPMVIVMSVLIPQVLVGTSPFTALRQIDVNIKSRQCCK